MTRSLFRDARTQAVFFSFHIFLFRFSFLWESCMSAVLDAAYHGWTPPPPPLSPDMVNQKPMDQGRATKQNVEEVTTGLGVANWLQ